MHRQTLYALKDVGEYKAVLAAERLRALNPEVDARAHTVRLTADNAVTVISGLKTKVIGADIDGDGTFDFIDAGAVGFNLGDGDTAIDGLVIVKTAGIPSGGLKPEPLIVVTV